MHLLCVCVCACERGERESHDSMSQGVVCILINSIYEPFPLGPALRGTPVH